MLELTTFQRDGFVGVPVLCDPWTLLWGQGNVNPCVTGAKALQHTVMSHKEPILLFSPLPFTSSIDLFLGRMPEENLFHYFGYWNLSLA